MDNLCQFLEPTGGHDRVVVEEERIPFPVAEAEVTGSHESHIRFAGEDPYPRIVLVEARRTSGISR